MRKIELQLDEILQGAEGDTLLQALGQLDTLEGVIVWYAEMLPKNPSEWSSKQCNHLRGLFELVDETYSRVTTVLDPKNSQTQRLLRQKLDELFRPPDPAASMD